MPIQRCSALGIGVGFSLLVVKCGYRRMPQAGLSRDLRSIIVGLVSYGWIRVHNVNKLNTSQIGFDLLTGGLMRETQVRREKGEIVTVAGI